MNDIQKQTLLTNLNNYRKSKDAYDKAAAEPLSEQVRLELIRDLSFHALVDVTTMYLGRDAYSLICDLPADMDENAFIQSLG